MKKIIIALLYVICISSLAFADNKQWTKEQERKISIFFSNFAEAYLENFEENKITDKILIDFSKTHIYKNRYKKLKGRVTATESFRLIPATMVDEISLKFFGKKPSKQEVKEYEYPDADGEAYVFAHIYGYEYNEKEDTYTVKGYIINAMHDFNGDPYGDISKWKKEGYEDVECFYTFVGKIKTSPLDKNRYILLSYQNREISEEELASFKKEYDGK